MLKDKVVIVTGGAGLLGKEFIRSIVKNGGVGIIADISEEQGNHILSELKEELQTGNADYVYLDITLKQSIKDIICFTIEKYGKIDALVNNAYPRNKNYGRKFEDVTYQDFCENINMHLGGYFLMMQQFAEYFKEQGYGNIINIASIYGLIAPRFEIYEDTEITTPVEYAAIKSAIIHLTKYVAKYLKGSNIRVNCISPGGIFNNQPESFLKNYKEHCLNKGMLSPNDISGTLIYLLSHQSKFVNGQNIIVDDGFTL